MMGSLVKNELGRIWGKKVTVV